ncbi:hypothetical protein EVJ58_g1982 [Rhodofomes roseus]|uniref:Uncharacterized protein n=1 Tax=Rhodofomes roseus TaxID=34475 RepID=A0A4Y9YUR4_9APHY|nr:hypothetical protein EVJ58_g1982 [Rhodofomes roseus]
MLSAIESSSGLEVLGIDVYFDTLGLNDLAILRRTIPKTVTALRLRLLYSPFDMDEPPEENIPWIELWAGLPRLAFAHVEDNEADPTVWYDDLAEAVKSLKILARRASFHEVERIDGNFTLGDSWSHTKVQFRTVEDFGCEDWEWLMRGHVLLDDLDY